MPQSQRRPLELRAGRGASSETSAEGRAAGCSLASDQTSGATPTSARVSGSHMGSVHPAEGAMGWFQYFWVGVLLTCGQGPDRPKVQQCTGQSG